MKLPKWLPKIFDFTCPRRTDSGAHRTRPFITRPRLLKKYDKKTEQANFARIEYQKILDEIRFYLRGEAFDEKVFLDRLKMKDNFVTDHCMEIPPSISKKYEKIFAPL